MPDNPLELDEELFSALGAQLGGENETLRNLLLDANDKIGELDTIKAAVGKLVDPVEQDAARLRGREDPRRSACRRCSTIPAPPTASCATRSATSRRSSPPQTSECQALRQDLATTQNLLRTLEATKAEIAIDVAARRAQIADLEARLAQETGETKALREENRRFDERLVAADKRIIALESDLNTARQRLLMADDEKRAQQTLLDKASAEAARLSRKLAETEASLNAVARPPAPRRSEFHRASNTNAPGSPSRSTRPTSATSTSAPASACASTPCRRARRRLEKLLGEAREHLLAARRGDPRIRPPHRRTDRTERDALQARRVRPAKPSASRANPNSRKSSRPAATCWSATPRSPAPSPPRKRRWRAPRTPTPRSTSASARLETDAGRRQADRRADRSRSSTRRCAARSSSARWQKARWRPPARTSPARCAR